MSLNIYKMLCTPNVLKRPEFVHINGNIVFSQEPPVSSHMHENLESSKRCVGTFRIRHGDMAWKHRAAAVDNNVNFGIDVKPISRAFFKLVEVMRTCALNPSTRTLHLCDAPGGFAQAICVLCPDVKEIIVTSRRKMGSPLFASALMKDRRVFELDLSDDSDIQAAGVRDQICKDVQNCSLITADGAVDNETQPELTEAVTARLLFYEVMTALRVQVAGGDFVLKVFGISLDITREFLAMLAICYETISIVKPFTSRSINDERYIVCQTFLPEQAVSFLALDKEYANSSLPYLVSLGFDIDPAWLKEVDELVYLLNQNQYRSINKALSLKDTLPYDGGKGRSSRGGPSQKRGRGIQKSYRGRGHRDSHTP